MELLLIIFKSFHFHDTFHNIFMSNTPAEQQWNVTKYTYFIILHVLKYNFEVLVLFFHFSRHFLLQYIYLTALFTVEIKILAYKTQEELIKCDVFL